MWISLRWAALRYSWQAILRAASPARRFTWTAVTTSWASEGVSLPHPQETVRDESIVMSIELRPLNTSAQSAFDGIDELIAACLGISGDGAVLQQTLKMRSLSACSPTSIAETFLHRALARIERNWHEAH